MFKRLALSALVLVVPVSAVAQMPVTAGGFVGRQFENKVDWIEFGGEARIALPGMEKMAASPRFTYRPLDGGKLIQIDLNLLNNFELAKPGLFRPYAGIGGAVSRPSFGSFSETKVGLNLVSGARIVAGNGPVEPFFNAQYTITKSFENAFALALGASVKVR